MIERRVRVVVFLAIFLVIGGVYLYSVAPTASFWDCGEFVAASYVLGIPHPPGTPLFVAIGRLFTFLPVNPEPAFRINFIPVLFGSFACGIIYLIVLKLISMYQERDRYPWIRHAAGAFAALLCGFAYSFWDNCVEAEVYGPCAAVALTVLLMALHWREKAETATGDNRLILLAVFMLFLSTGIHFTPMMVVFAVLIFALLVDRESIIQLRLFEFVIGFLVVLTIAAMGGEGPENVALKIVVAALMLASAYFGIRVMERSERNLSVIWGLCLLSLSFVIGYVASGGDVMDNAVLLLASPTVALIEMWVQAKGLVILFALGYAAYLYWLHRQRQLRPKYVALMLGLILVASSVQFLLLIRAKAGPPINEVDPSKWRDFVSVLRREQYDPMKVYPRKTMFLTEEDYRQGTNPRYSLLVGYFEQVKFYLRYFFWQWGNERFFDILLGVKPWAVILGLIPPLLGLWGIWHQFREEKKSFVLIFVALLVASVGLITYLNLKYSPSDPRPHLRYREVRERDYFYAFSFVFYTIFIGVGAHAFLHYVIERFKLKRLLAGALSGATVAFAFVPMVLNYETVTRRHNWIPAEYGYNMLISCPGEHAVIFTNGDNDTFPLWFMQTVPSRVAGLDPKFGKNVAVANLSLLNTNWYCKQLKRWGAPISFTETEIDRLPQGFVGKQGRTYLLKDIMIRDIVATSAGVRLRWPDDYGSTSQEFMTKVFASGYRARTPVYFATTVSGDNLADVEPYLRLEGLVNRVVAERASKQVDIERTRHLLFDVYRMNSMLDPRVSKDENTRGLLINYAASYLALALEYQKLGQNREAQDVMTRALAFDLESDRKIPLFYHLSVFALLNGDYDNALVYLDSIQQHGFDDPELTLRRGLAYQGKGDYPQAEQAFRSAVEQSPNRPEPIQALFRLYVEDLHDTARARQLLENWLRRVPQDSIAQRMLKGIS